MRISDDELGRLLERARAHVAKIQARKMGHLFDETDSVGMIEAKVSRAVGPTGDARSGCRSAQAQDMLLEPGESDESMLVGAEPITAPVWYEHELVGPNQTER